MKHIIVSSALVLSVVSAHASSILKTESGAKTIESIKVAEKGTVSVKGQNTEVGLVGAGLRRKKVAILKVKIYVAELLASSPEKYVRTDSGALDSLSHSQTVAIRLNFVYSVDGATVKQAFTDALKSNNIDTNETAMVKLMQTIAQAGEFKTGEAITFVSQKEANGQETLYFENPRGVVTEIAAQKGFGKNFFSLWLAKPADDMTAELKSQLVKGL